MEGMENQRIPINVMKDLQDALRPLGYAVMGFRKKGDDISLLLTKATFLTGKDFEDL